jgi:radical SAM superfamily enzyme YgiQ (UPF0313 family)
MESIVLTTLNAKYIHTALGLRSLYANLGELQPVARIQEHIITDHLSDVAEQLLAGAPAVIGIGVYIWNAAETRRLVSLIKKVAPKTVIVLGGPEVSHAPLRVRFDKADYIIQGEGEAAFYRLCKRLLRGQRPKARTIRAPAPDLNTLALPYDHYTDEDIAHRVIYVESARGCAFACDFCLSSADTAVRAFDLDKVLACLSVLWDRGARTFKFVDRVFNRDIRRCNRILDFFLAKEPPYLVHCEMMPEILPESLRQRLRRFPPASIQLEIGIQTLDPKTAARIHRPCRVQRIRSHLRYLAARTNAHLHLDLIAGLPGESLERFGQNLDQLLSFASAEVQIGILKYLSGTPLQRHIGPFKMAFSDSPPYEILQNDRITFQMFQKVKRFARFWDLVYNRGNFPKTCPRLWQGQGVFDGFFAFSEWAYPRADHIGRISLERLAGLVFRYLTDVRKQDKTAVADTMARDLMRVRGRALPAFIKKNASSLPKGPARGLKKINPRQVKHSQWK